MFIYVNSKSSQRPEVSEFVKFYLKNAAEMVTQVKYVALPAKAYLMAEEHFSKGKIGTVFASGSHVGLKIEELMKKETTH